MIRFCRWKNWVDDDYRREEGRESRGSVDETAAADRVADPDDETISPGARGRLRETGCGCRGVKGEEVTVVKGDGRECFS